MLLGVSLERSRGLLGGSLGGSSRPPAARRRGDRGADTAAAWSPSRGAWGPLPAGCLDGRLDLAFPREIVVCGPSPPERAGEACLSAQPPWTPEEHEFAIEAFQIAPRPALGPRARAAFPGPRADLRGLSAPGGACASPARRSGRRQGRRARRAYISPS